jgi:hypothetical protein
LDHDPIAKITIILAIFSFSFAQLQLIQPGEDESITGFSESRQPPPTLPRLEQTECRLDLGNADPVLTAATSAAWRRRLRMPAPPGTVISTSCRAVFTDSSGNRWRCHAFLEVSAPPAPHLLFVSLPTRLGTNVTPWILLASIRSWSSGRRQPLRCPWQTGARQPPVTPVCTWGRLCFGRQALPSCPKPFSGSSASGE